MFKPTSTEKYTAATVRPPLPDDKINEVVELIKSGSDESTIKINALMETYKFSSMNLGEIIKLAPINGILSINLSIIRPKAVVRIIASCVNVIKKSSDEKLKYKCRRILDIACERLHMINFGKEEFLELAEIDDKRISDYIEATSNSEDVQTKMMLPKDKTEYVVKLLESSSVERIREINQMIEQYKFSDEKMTEILKNTPLEKLLLVNTAVLNPKIFVRVIACCVKALKAEQDPAVREKFSKIFDFTFDKMQLVTLDMKEYLELAEIDDERIINFVQKSNHLEIQAVLNQKKAK